MDDASLHVLQPDAEDSALFSCRRCGHCCQGRGGIVVGSRDLKRLCDFLHLDEATFLNRHTEQRGGKPALLTGADGYCDFYRQGEGCAIHPARPDVCRAWPYFRGNLVDVQSFFMARQDCPGISPEADHTAFAHEGFAYLQRNHLLGSDPARDGRALIVHESELPPLQTSPAAMAAADPDSSSAEAPDATERDA